MLSAKLRVAVQRMVVGCVSKSAKQLALPPASWTAVFCSHVNAVGLKTKLVILDYWKSFSRNHRFFSLNENGDGNRRNGNENGKKIR